MVYIYNILLVYGVKDRSANRVELMIDLILGCLSDIAEVIGMGCCARDG